MKTRFISVAVLLVVLALVSPARAAAAGATVTVVASAADQNGTIKPAGNVVIKTGKSKSFTAKPLQTHRAGLKLDGVLVAEGTVGQSVKYKVNGLTHDATLVAVFAAGDEPFAGDEPPSEVVLALLGLGDSVLVTSNKTPTIRGMAGSDRGISRVVYSNLTTRATGLAVGTNEWSIPVTLATGDNQLRFTAQGPGGSSLTVDTTVTYYRGLDFTTPLMISTDVLYTNETTNVTFHVGVANAVGVTAVLYRCESSGLTTQIVANLKDDGVLPDEIQSDGNFTLVLPMTATTPGFQYLRAGVIRNGSISYFTELHPILVTPHYTPAQVRAALDIAAGAQQSYTEQLAGGQTPAEAATATVAAWKTNPAIGAIGARQQGVWWITAAGILGYYHPSLAGQRAGGELGEGAAAERGAPSLLTDPLGPRVRYYPAPAVTDPAAPGRALAVAATGAANTIRGKKALLISPYLNNPNDGPNFGTTDDYYGAWQILVASNSCSLRAATSLVNDGTVNVGLDSFKTLGEYGYIQLCTHGDLLFNGLLAEWQDAWGPRSWLQGSRSHAVLATGLKLPRTAGGAADVRSVEADLKMKRVAVGVDGALALTPAFLRQYVSNLPNSLVVLASCRSTANNALAYHFLSRGAGAVVGFTDYVNSEYARQTTTRIINEMLGGRSVQEAIDSATDLFGTSDGDADPAYLTRVGAADLLLSSGRLENLGFENGVLSPWVRAGDGRVITQLGSASPTEGSSMAIISTGLGYTTASGSIEQDFCATAELDQLTFDWNFFSEEFIEFCNSAYQDAFRVSICVVDDVGNETCTEVFTRIVDDLCGIVKEADVGFDKGGVYSTGWQHTALDLAAYAGERLIIRFYATDVGDSIFDTAILVDNIQVTERAPSAAR